MPKKRLDLLMVERGLAPNQAAAAARILAAEVSSSGRVLDKPGLSFDTTIDLQVQPARRYVSRGGEKLKSVAVELGLDFNHKVILDVGSSAGGFTDFALQQGAAKVYAVDVGNAQLDWKLRHNERVEVMERTDIRRLTDLDEPVDWILVDVSFISLTRILPLLPKFLTVGGSILVMAKPQFEADKVLADRYQGVIPEPERSKVLEQFEARIEAQFITVGRQDSKVPGAKGNVERFYLLKPR